MAYTQAIRPKIENIQKKILSAHAYRDRYDGHIIAEPARAFAMPDEDFAEYDLLVQEAYSRAGYVFEPGTCPLQVAENLEEQARDVMIKLSAELKTGIDPRRLYSNMKWLEEYTDLLLKLLVPLIDRALLTIPKPGNDEK
ncbi:MAG: hypothetical protein J0H07_30240 [Sphingobacteriales bacterium]|nr:hypothetical protein [Sphingobacteriales bacterium]